MAEFDQTPDEFMDMPCKACGHDISIHKTSEGAMGYPCTWQEVKDGTASFEGSTLVVCQCQFFQG